MTFYPDASVRTVLDHVQIPAFRAAYGEYVEELVHLCELLDVQTVVDA